MTARRTASGALNPQQPGLVQRPVNVMLRRSARALALFILLSSSSIDAQRPTAAAFEVVSIKPMTLMLQGTTMARLPALLQNEVQLGLKLEPARGPVLLHIIDSVELPTAD